MTQQEMRQKNKKIILRVLLGSVLVLALMGGVIVLLEHLLTKEGPPRESLFHFYPAYEGDIMENPDYLEHNRQMDYCDDPSGYGMTISVTDENREDFDDTVLFLCDFLQTVIAGDNRTYRSFLSQEYLEKRGMPKAFNPQMLYNMKITFRSATPDAQGGVASVYALDYMIYRNDGSYRRDVGSDAIVKQYIHLYTDADGNIRVDDLYSIYTK